MAKQTPDFSKIRVFDGSPLLANYNITTREATIVGLAGRSIATEEEISCVVNSNPLFRNYNPKTKTVELVRKNES
jgi:hypothetical protein